MVIEAAAMNHRAKEMGFDATQTFEDRLTQLITKNAVSYTHLGVLSRGVR